MRTNKGQHPRASVLVQKSKRKLFTFVVANRKKQGFYLQNTDMD